MYNQKICTKLQTNLFHTNSVLGQKLIGAVRFTSTNFNVSPKKIVIKKASGSKSAGFGSFEMSSFIDDIVSEDNRIAVQDKPIKELFRSSIVYKLCSSQWLVNHAPSLLQFSEKAHLSAFIYWIIRKTFFAQFCGGETAEECINFMPQLNKHGIGLILGLSIEADINENGSLPPDGRTLSNNLADYVLNLMVECIENAATQPNSFVAVKLTGLANPTILQKWSSALNILSTSFDKFDLDKDGKLERSNFLQLVCELFNDDVADTLFEQADKNKDGLINKSEFINVLSLDNLYSRPLWVLNGDFRLNKQDFDDYDKMMDRLKKLCEIARIKNVRLLMDAEQSYFQSAIDHVTMTLSKNYNKLDNKNGPIIFNTYQMYLKDSTERLIQNYNSSSREQFVFAAKLVRGAYMISERERAENLGYPNPICNTLEDTHAAYDYAVKYLLNELSGFQKRSNKQLYISNSPIVFMIASHNKESIIKACEQMKSLNISPKSGLVLFGQLLGMRDQISYTLGKYDYGVYKYVPYGRINEVIPFLIRRVQENSAVLEGIREEKQILWREIMSRIFHTRLSLPSASA